ncbi:hypothetical protein PENSPDRAFT_366904 [Peniophora sp. CONT]|nr:hypothetical protein PENSPDRAFT_366904 [Peniophora sp. CONT]
MSANSGTYYYENGAPQDDRSATYEPQFGTWGGYGHMPLRPEQFAAPVCALWLIVLTSSHASKPFVAQVDQSRIPQTRYTQPYNPAPFNPYGAPYAAAQGSAGYAYQVMNPAPAPIAPTAVFTPLPPHNTKTRESGQSSTAPIDASYPVSPLVSCPCACS